MRSKKSDLPLLALFVFSAGLATACGESPDDRRETLRAEAEREFGRPTASDPDGAVDTENQPVDARPDGTDTPSGSTSPPPAEPPAVESTPPSGGEAETEAGSEIPPAGTPVSEDAPTSEEPAVTPVPADQVPSASALLADADRAYSGLTSLRATFVQRVEVPLLDRTSQGYGSWLQQGRDHFRMDFVDPPDDLFVADGEFLWLYQPSATPGQVIQCELAGGRAAAGGADLLARILSEARGSYDATYEGTAIVTGARSHVIGLLPRGPSEYREVRIWVGDGDRLVRRFRIVEENETIRTVTLADLEPNVSIDGSLFTWATPEGTDVFGC